MQEFITAFMQPDGMNQVLIYFLLIIPFIALIGSIARHIIGIKTLNLGVFTSIVFVLAFLIRNNSVYSVLIGLLMINFIYYFSYIVKKFAVNSSLHYYARISFVLASVSLAVAILFLTAFQIPFIRENLSFTLINPFSVVIAVALAEQFSSHQIQKGIKTSRTLFVNTIILAGISAFIFSISWIEIFILTYPYTVIIPLIFTYFLGKYQGIRLTEVLRFQKIANNLEKAND